MLYIPREDQAPRMAWAMPIVHGGDMMSFFSPYNGRAAFMGRVARHEGVSPPQVYVDDVRKEPLMSYEMMGSYELGGMGVSPGPAATSLPYGVFQNLTGVQTALIGAGISVGRTGADGVWGPCTAQGLRRYIETYGITQAQQTFGSALCSRAQSTTGSCASGTAPGGGGGGGAPGGGAAPGGSTPGGGALTSTIWGNISANLSNPVVWIGGIGLIAAGIFFLKWLEGRKRGGGSKQLRGLSAMAAGY